jgi:glycosyltransferase involved in cell wall biosynthesis/SAM-dependent methyltransferase
MSNDSGKPDGLAWSGERYVPSIDGNIRLEHVHRYLVARAWCHGRRVLDIACGEGYGSDLLAQVADRVYGVDVAPEAVGHARKTYPRPNLEFRLGDCASIPLPDASVDVVVSFETIEHHERHEEMMREVRRVLVPGGTLVISSPDRREYSEVPGYTNPFHVRELYRDEFERLLRSHFRHVTVAGQRVKAGSLVWPIDEVDARPFEGFTSTASLDRVEPLGPPLYLLAVASDDPVRPIPAGMLDGGGFVWYAEHMAAFEAAEQPWRARLDGLEAERTEAQARAAAAESASTAAVERAAAAERDRSEAERALAAAEAARVAAEEEASAQRTQAAALQSTVAELDADRHRLEALVRSIERSHSWRLTAPLRAARRGLGGGQPTVRSLERAAREVYGTLPLSASSRLRIRSGLFRAFPFLFNRTAAYRAWDAYRRTAARLPAAPVAAPEQIQPGALPPWFYAEPSDDFVALSPSVRVDTSIKAIAFYLPQFHPIPENDRWWGKGFTEWTNVTRGKPQYAGHYQPHLPGELGFYDLRLPEVQRRQIELAKMYGIHGFCYHHYWFGGTRLLRQPLDQLLANPDMDFPFCLCWANENWTRRWDGRDTEVLIAQRHSPEDDLAFIRDIEPALRDPRYIRVGERPLLVVYRPALLPDARATAGRWRKYCRDAGLGDLYLVATHAFDRVDPHELGFDAALEFAPNNLGAPAVTAQMPLVNPDFGGVIYDYRYIVEHSRTCEPPDSYVLFRSATPMWDNEARRPGRGAIFANSSPALYRQALEHVCRYTDLHVSDSPLVFLNAWNEWAEGAHLEPDRRYGYAYLQATADALNQFPAGGQRLPIVLVSHDAHFHGAQRVALTLAHTLSGMGGDVDILLCGDGPLRPEFEKHGRVHDFFSAESTPERRRAIIRRIHDAGARVALCNTSVVGSTVEMLDQAGFTVVSMVHELPGLIKEHGLEDSIAAIARSADRIVFPAGVVRDRFVELTGVDPARTLVRPQGLLAPNRYRDRRDEARRALRAELGLPGDGTVVLGMGYADRRKGLDLFVEAGLRLLATVPGLTMVWVGHAEAETLADAHARIVAASAEPRFLFPGLVEESDVYFAGADVFLMTSREDPFPLVILHALDAEIPVVGFEGAGGFVELLRRGCGVLVPYLDAPAMAAAVTRLLSNPEERERLAVAGRGIIDNEFDFLSYTRFLVELGSAGAPSISVIVPNYNYARYLPARLRSILAQTRRPHEIIVLDDCSSDESVAVAEQVLQDSPIPYRILRNEVNQGCYRQWLKGLREASGDLVWIAEADDDCEPTLLATLAAAFANPSVTLAYCQSTQIDGEGRELAPDYLAWTADVSATKWRAAYVRRGVDEITDTLVIKNTIPNVSGVLMRRPDVSAIESRLVTLKNAGDWLVYVHVLEQGDVAFVPAALNHHRRHQGSLTIGKGGLNLMQEILQVQQYIRERHAIPPEVEEKRVAHLQTTYEYLRLDAEGPGSYHDHEALRPMAGTLAD